MKYITTVLFLLLTLSSYSKPEEKKIIGRIIPASKEEPLLLTTTEGTATSCWALSEEIVETVQPVLLKYLEDKGDKWSRFEKEVYDNLSAYRCQYYGLIINGNHQIFCNFFLVTERSNGWKKEDYPIGYSTCGGGLHYFRFVYDIKEGKCKAFIFNGP